jgi:hypothetical protein
MKAELKTCARSRSKNAKYEIKMSEHIAQKKKEERER